jgi:hypothetical protein
MPTKEEVLEFIADCQDAITSELVQSELNVSHPYYSEQVARHMIALGKLEKELLGEIQTMVDQRPMPLNFIKAVAEMHKKSAISAIGNFARVKHQIRFD